MLEALESGHLTKLRFLGIEMNYLTVASMAALGTTIGKLRCPLLSQISYNENSVDDALAKRTIATAVYHERMRAAQREQERTHRDTASNASSDDEYSSEDDDDDDDGDGNGEDRLQGQDRRYAMVA